ncbi:F-box/kelch-repeat protein At3g23880-like [Daucus carota subsp. sativus]|uniref:F-box/kelch-repeat protein At3g23880-like n=1 Tax=Daucus carota subsp. sativus TaxID=79200 RepID=UPI0007EFE97E|nr:PREDICTED: F-box/kelch-repeat protein At3g23880-like [Daucus carota subsp. sativus]
MASKNSTTSFDDLPQEAAANILLRLPVKALIRSTSVNKNWYSLITNPHFISAQIKRAVLHSHDNAVFVIHHSVSQQKHCSLVSAETSKLFEKFEIPFTTKSGKLQLVGSVNGLMLLTDSHMFHSSRDLYLWNPCLKTHRTLVSSCFKNLRDNPYRSYCIVGLGFNEACDDYRVVRVVYSMDNKCNHLGEVCPKAEIYSLRKQTWRKIKDSAVTRLGASDGVFVKGRFYWLEMKKPITQETGRPYNSKDLWMLSFDFDNEVFGELKFPENVSNCLGRGSRYKLMEFEGSLSLCVYEVQCCNGVVVHPYRLWLMMQGNGVITWTLRFKVALKEGGFPMSITKAGTVLIETIRGLPNDLSGIISCNLKSLWYKDLGFYKHGGVESSLFCPEDFTVDTSFVESLVMYEGGKSLLKFAK